MLQRHVSRPRAVAVIVLAGLTLSACGTGAFVDRRRDAGYNKLTYVGESQPNAPSICYNTWTAKPADVVALAREVCAQSGQVPVLKDQSTFDCRLFYPARANFRCVAPADAPISPPAAP
jgi:hypothetical protein